jgi:hypothetical protein
MGLQDEPTTNFPISKNNRHAYRVLKNSERLWTGSTNTFRLISATYASTPGVAIITLGGQPILEPTSVMIASPFSGGAALKRWRNKRA